MEYKLDNRIVIEYTEKDEEYIQDLINLLKTEIPNVNAFFGLKSLDNTLTIKIWDSIEDYRNFANSWMATPSWSVGFAQERKDGYKVHLLTYSERLKAESHSNDSIEQLTKTALHEYVHNACNCFRKRHPDFDWKYSPTWLNEGIALNLAKQSYSFGLNCTLSDLIEDKHVKYSNYYTLVNYLLKSQPREFLMSLLINSDLAKQETPTIYNETLNYIEKQAS